MEKNEELLCPKARPLGWHRKDQAKHSVPLKSDGVNKGLTLTGKAFVDRLRGENRN